MKTTRNPPRARSGSRRFSLGDSRGDGSSGPGPALEERVGATHVWTRRSVMGLLGAGAATVLGLGLEEGWWRRSVARAHVTPRRLDVGSGGLMTAVPALPPPPHPVTGQKTGPDPANPAVTVTVVTRTHPLRTAGAWWTWGNTSTDAYVFSFAGIPRLLVEFRGRTALIWAADPGSGPLSVAVRDGALVTDGALQAFVVGSGPWVEDGRPNYNGTLFWLKHGSSLLAGTVLVPPDAPMGFRIGSDRPGVPAWMTGNLIGPVPGRWPGRFWAQVAFAAQYRPPPIVWPTFPWLGWTLRPPPPYATYRRDPYLLSFEAYGLRRGFQLNAPWGYGIGGMYHITKQSRPQLVREDAPVVWYTFARGTRIPQLDVHQHQEPPWQQWRYSWSTNPDPSRPAWNYALHLTGPSSLVAPTEPSRIGGVLVDTPGPWGLPEWIVSKAWANGVSFIHQVGEPEVSSEGLYNFTPPVPSTGSPGGLEAPILTDTKTAKDGLRPGQYGDWAFGLKGPPRLYRNTVDGWLHLDGAAQGTWNLGQGRYLRLRAWSGRQFDEWVRLSGRPNEPARGGRVEEKLFVVGRWAWYQGPAGVVLVRTRIQPVQPETVYPPPFDPASWRMWVALDRQAGRDPGSLFQWLEGPEVVYRAGGGGWSVVAGTPPTLDLSIPRGSEVLAPARGIRLPEAPGRYRILGENGGFRMVDAAP